MLIGCTYRWSSQPKIPHLKGCGNILVLAAAEVAGIGYFKIEKFANILNLQFLKSPFTINMGDFIYLEINRSLEKNQGEQFEEIQESRRTFSLVLIRQCDSPGHNARYNTVTTLDVKINILDIKIVYVKVRFSSLVLLPTYP